MANHSHDAKQVEVTRDEALQMIYAAQERISVHSGSKIMGPLLEMPLTIQQLRTLGLLFTEPQHNTGAQLAERLGISLATISGIIDRLITLDMVARHEDPDDLRVRRITLTEPGHAVISDFFDSQRQLTDQLLAELTTEQLVGLAIGVDGLAQALSNQTNPDTPTT